MPDVTLTVDGKKIAAPAGTVPIAGEQEPIGAAR